MSEIIWGGEIILRDQKNRYTNLFPFMLSWRFSKAALGFWHKFQLSFPSCFPHLKWCPRAPNWRRQPAAAVISPALLWAAEWKISFYLLSLDQISTKSIWFFHLNNAYIFYFTIWVPVLILESIFLQKNL